MMQHLISKYFFLGSLFILSTIGYGQYTVHYSSFDSLIANDTVDFLVGKWHINELLLPKKSKEYVLYKKDTSRQFDYGNALAMLPNGQFVSNYSAKCGMDRFTTTSGTYKMVNEKYVAFNLQHVDEFGGINRASRSLNNTGNRDSALNIDLGLYRIYIEDNSIRLRQSNGNEKEDDQNLLYERILRDALPIVSKYAYRKWLETDYLVKKEDIAGFAMKHYGITDYKVLYEYGNLILVRTNNEYRYVAYQYPQKEKILISLYDDDFESRIESAYQHILAIENFTEVTINDTFDNRRNPLSVNTITLYSSQDTLRKVVYKGQLRDLKTYSQTYYFHNNEPIVFEFELYGLKDVYIIYDWNNKYGAKLTAPAKHSYAFPSAKENFHAFWQYLNGSQK